MRCCGALAIPVASIEDVGGKGVIAEAEASTDIGIRVGVHLPQHDRSVCVCSYVPLFRFNSSLFRSVMFRWRSYRLCVCTF